MTCAPKDLCKRPASHKICVPKDIDWSRVIVPTDGNSCLLLSGDFGKSPFYRQPSAGQGSSCLEAYDTGRPIRSDSKVGLCLAAPAQTFRAACLCRLCAFAGGCRSMFAFWSKAGIAT